MTHDDRFNHDISVPHDDRFNHDISVPHDDHLRAGNYDSSFKGHVKHLGVSTDATVYTDHISRSAYLEIRRISSIRHLLATKATAQLMCSFVLSRLDYDNSLLIDINCDQMYRLEHAQSHAAKVIFRKSRHEHDRLPVKALHWLPVKERIIFKIATFVFRVTDSTLPSCLPAYIPNRTLRSSSDDERNKNKLFLVQDGNLQLWLPVVLCSGSPCLEQPSCSHPIPQFSLTVQTFSLNCSLYFCHL